MKIKLSPDAISVLANASRFTPRVANRLLKRARDFAEVNNSKIVDAEVASETLKLLEVDYLGLESCERCLLEIIIKKFNNRPVGVNALAAVLGEEKGTIEYHLEDIEQTQVDEDASYTFANGLRSLMRQDPDVILVGEIRDRETGEIAVQAALTGHLVFSTLHTNQAAGAIPRLLDLGVKASSIGPALNLVIAQRLVRRLCEDCKVPGEIDGTLKNKIEKFLAGIPKRVNREKFKEIKIFKPKGCAKCNNTGYKGRIGIYELFLNDPEYEKLLIDPESAGPSSHKTLEELIGQQAGESAIKKFALEQGMVTMQQDGILKIISGTTTFEEVEGITGPIQLG